MAMINPRTQKNSENSVALLFEPKPKLKPAASTTEDVKNMTEN
jgi:hypothetical protein